MISSVTSSAACAMNASRIGNRRSGDIRCNAWFVERRPMPASSLRAVGRPPRSVRITPSCVFYAIAVEQALAAARRPMAAEVNADMDADQEGA